MATHTSMAGGIVYNDKGKETVSYTEFDKFYDHYIQKLSIMYLVERVRYPCKFFIDIDGEYEIDTLISLYPDNHFIVCVNEENDGYHVIFQDVTVETDVEAKELCKDSFDTSVYRTGLRMIGSKKKPESFRRYYPRFEVKNSVVSKIEPEINKENLYKCSILIPGKSYVLASNLPKKKQKGGSIVTCESICHNEMYDFSKIHPNYSEVVIKSIKQREETDTKLLETNERFCTNVSREHKSNRVYFVLRNKNNRPSIVQMCCDEDCKGYESESMKITLRQYSKFI